MSKAGYLTIRAALDRKKRAEASAVLGGLRRREERQRMENTRNIPSIFGTGAADGDWQGQRRAEVLRLFEEIEFGSMPTTGYTLRFEEPSPARPVLDGAALMHAPELVFAVGTDEYRVPFSLLVPAEASAQTPCPANLFIYAYENDAPGYPMERIDIYGAFDNPYWPAHRMVERGYAAAAFYVKDVESDNAGAFPSGLVRFFAAHSETAGHTGRCIAAWAFAARHILDYLAACDGIDARALTVAGHSRCGKTALWCGAADTRIACTFANNSGCGGASLARGTSGERVGQITRAFPHWLCAAYAEYAGREEELPFDQHMLLGLLAPRLVYTVSGSQDAWADPEGAFLSCVLAGEAYVQYGLPGLETDVPPAPGVPLHKGRIGHHVRAGGHDLTLYDWEQFMDFFDVHRLEMA